MKRFIAVLFASAHALSVIAGCAVTYQTNEYTSEGRFGDHLHQFTFARWAAYKNNMPLLYCPFRYSDQLMLAVNHERYTPSCESRFAKKHLMAHHEVIYNLDKSVDTLYNFGNLSLFDKPYWCDPEFAEVMRKDLAPRYPLAFSPDRSKISVAVHFRRGGGFDGPLISEQLIPEKQVDACRERLINPPCKGWMNKWWTNQGGKRAPYSDVLFPAKFLPVDYYTQQIKVVAKMFEGLPLVVYILTDDANTKKVIKEFQDGLVGVNAVVKIREEGNRHDANVVEDFFAMMACDCLIRNVSHMSLWPALIGEHALVISPDASNDGYGYVHWEVEPAVDAPGNYRAHIVIDKVTMKLNEKKMEDVKRRVQTVS